MKTYADLVAEAKLRIREVTPAQVMEMRRAAAPLTLIDVRDINEVNMGTIPESVHLSRGNLENGIESVVDRGATVVLFCSGGSRSALAAVSLQEMGYTNVASMAGGIVGWIDSGGDIE